MAFKLDGTFGPLMFKVKVVPAVKGDDDESSDLKTVCVGTNICAAECTAHADGEHVVAHPAARVNQKMRCSSCQREESSHWPYPRGRDNGDGTFTVVGRDELDSAGVDSTVKTQLNIVRVPRSQVDQMGIPCGKFYWLAPDGGPKPENYALVRDTMVADAEEWAYTAEWAPRSASKPALLVVKGNVIGLQQLGWPQDINARPEVDLPAYDERALPMAQMAAEFITTEFDPATFQDTRREKVAAILAASQPVAAAGDAAPTTVGTAHDVVAELEAFLAKQGKAAGKKKAAKKVADTPPVQPLPEELPANVKVVTPRKRAAKKSAPAVKKSA